MAHGDVGRTSAQVPLYIGSDEPGKRSESRGEADTDRGRSRSLSRRWRASEIWTIGTFPVNVLGDCVLVRLHGGRPVWIPTT